MRFVWLVVVDKMSEPTPLKKSVHYWNGLDIVSDPLDPGGFPAGLHLPELEILNMISSQTFTEGTVLVDQRGKLYVYLVQEL